MAGKLKSHVPKYFILKNSRKKLPAELGESVRSVWKYSMIYCTGLILFCQDKRLFVDFRIVGSAQQVINGTIQIVGNFGYCF